MIKVLSKDPHIEATHVPHADAWNIWYLQSGCEPGRDRLYALKNHIENSSGGRILIDVERGYDGLIEMKVSPLAERMHDDVDGYLQIISIVLEASCPTSKFYTPDLSILEIIVDRAASAK